MFPDMHKLPHLRCLTKKQGTWFCFLDTILYHVVFGDSVFGRHQTKKFAVQTDPNHMSPEAFSETVFEIPLISLHRVLKGR